MNNAESAAPLLDLSLDREKGEVKILNERLAVIDITAFCERMNALVGMKVAEVQIKSLEHRLGEEDASAIMKEKSDATVEQLIDFLSEIDLISGIGVTKVSRDSDKRIHVETHNPIVAGVEGAAASFISGWWCGAMDSVFNRRFDVRETKYDRQNDVLKFDLVER